MANKVTSEYIFSHLLENAERLIPDTERVSSFCAHIKTRKEHICQCYFGINHTIKANYMEDVNGLLDRHKCAAAFMIAFMTKADLEKIGLGKLALEHIAIQIGLIVLKLFICYENRNFKEAGILSFIEKNGFKPPPCICDHKPYFENWALGLHYARREDKLFPLSLSNELFCFEMYNRQLMEIEHLKQDMGVEM